MKDNPHADQLTNRTIGFVENCWCCFDLTGLGLDLSRIVVFLFAFVFAFAVAFAFAFAFEFDFDVHVFGISGGTLLSPPWCHSWCHPIPPCAWVSSRSCSSASG